MPRLGWTGRRRYGITVGQGLNPVGGSETQLPDNARGGYARFHKGGGAAKLPDCPAANTAQAPPPPHPRGNAPRLSSGPDFPTWALHRAMHARAASSSRSRRRVAPRAPARPTDRAGSLPDLRVYRSKRAQPSTRGNFPAMDEQQRYLFDLNVL